MWPLHPRSRPSDAVLGGGGRRGPVELRGGRGTVGGGGRRVLRQNGRLWWSLALVVKVVHGPAGRQHPVALSRFQRVR